MSLAHEINNTARTKDVIVTEDITFEGMILSDNTLNGLNAAGFRRPSPVQLHAIPIGKCGFDLLIEAKSGTGKTAVFAVIALEMLELNNNLQVVVLAPTREIAYQVHDVIKMIGCKYKDLSVEVVMGGTSLGDDKNKFSKLTKPQIIVGSPGRLRHIIQDNIINVSNVRLFVMDEADKLMEDSFQADVNFIFSKLPERKQVIANSATYTEALRMFVGRYMRSPSHIKPNNSSVLLGVKQNVTLVDSHENVMKQVSIKYAELKKIFENISFKQCLVFCNYQKRAKDLCSSLKRDGWPAEYLAGNQTQIERLTGLKNLQEFKCRILIATDLASRGIDAANVDLVINFELPYDVATYLHRIGRAGRYGSYGSTTSIIVKGKQECDFEKMIAVLGDNIKLTELWTSDSFKTPSTEDLKVPNCSNPQNKEVIGTKSDLISSQDLSSLHKYICKDLPSANTGESFKTLLESFDKFEIDSVLNAPLNTISTQSEIERLPENLSNKIKHYVDHIFLSGFNKTVSCGLSDSTDMKESCSSPILNEENFNQSPNNVCEGAVAECVQSSRKVRRKPKKSRQIKCQKSIEQINKKSTAFERLENSDASADSSGDRISDSHLKYDDTKYSYTIQPLHEVSNAEENNYTSYCVPENNTTAEYKNFDTNYSQKNYNVQLKQRANTTNSVEQELHQRTLYNAPNKGYIPEQTRQCTYSSSSERVLKTLKYPQRRTRTKYEDRSNVTQSEYEVWRSQLALVATQIQQTVYMREMSRQ